MEVNRLQLQSTSEATPGDLGFKLIGESREQQGRLARIWVRRKKGAERHVWTRYLEAETRSAQWEVRLHLKRGTGAMTLAEFSPAVLDELAANFAFPRDPATLAQLKAVVNADPLFNLVRDWVVKVTTEDAAPPTP